MKKKIIALVTALLMIMCMIPSVAFAGSYTINSSGSYTMSSFGYASGDNITIGNGLTVALIGDSTTMYTNFWISCGAGVTLTISNVNIDENTNNYVSPLTFTGSGNTLILADGTSNTLIGGAKHAGICVEEGTELTIRGNGTLNAVGNGFEEESETNGSAGIGATMAIARASLQSPAELLTRQQMNMAQASVAATEETALLLLPAAQLPRPAEFWVRASAVATEPVRSIFPVARS